MKLFEDGTLKVIIHSTFKYSQIAEAMKIVEDNQAVGKVVLENDLWNLYIKSMISLNIIEGFKL